MGDHLRVVLGRPSELDPLGGARVLLSLAAAGIWPYATSWTRRWQEGVLGLAFDRGPPLAAHELLALERAWSVSSTPHQLRPFSGSAAPDQKTLPTTAASWRRAFSCGSRRSSRAAMMPWMVSGTGSSSDRPRSSSMRANCSA